MRPGSLLIQQLKEWEVEETCALADFSYCKRPWSQSRLVRFLFFMDLANFARVPSHRRMDGAELLGAATERETRNSS